ncbi:hypothetical protein FRB94_004850 [Tulasnella sp. JGI-2019a]|nr:hypothetical protein FRB93_005831 [Tulasnella sp. JGI-2019a]KAG9001302.1 hypothetical protein FRB94_004850 [Tulasnella sp. JGI-2019a]KAG9027296.1 hypothetical protein FRB95_007926 [Tulasnella sp. JGI-2019a]
MAAPRDGVYVIRNVASNTIITIGSKVDERRKAAGYAPRSGLVQQWRITKQADESYQITSKDDPTLFLGYDQDGFEELALITESAPSWKLQLVNQWIKAFYIMTPKGWVMDLSYSSPKDDTPITIYLKHGGPNQQWKLERVPLSSTSSSS